MTTQEKIEKYRTEHKCLCKKIMCIDRVYIHLTGCPESYYIEEYYNTNWFKRMFMEKPDVAYYQFYKL